MVFIPSPLREKVARQRRMRGEELQRALVEKSNP
jgi:DNA-binding phage protein